MKTTKLPIKCESESKLSVCVCNEVFSLPIVYVLNNDACIHFRCKTHLLRITFLSFVLPLDPVDTMFSITPCNDMSFLTISLEILTGFPLILVPSPSNPLNCLIGFFLAFCNVPKPSQVVFGITKP